ncbi:hypothetical protein EDB81DRAFT_810107 [Dactylonectria macrodidyma]|uniref:RING-type domain-containing protein n=1 Tax=Dactylonectria macrodidyma TaxID=307937 RepID=A0A9P9IKR3_9HYPO|nr:hypothetical protein EDB81DRAFT_810107 [Dactylonectria macrodidyma]
MIHFLPDDLPSFKCSSFSKMEQELTCGICQSIFFDPVKLLDCQHIYCGACIKTWLSSPSASCPHCRIVPRAVTTDRIINNLAEAYSTDNPDKAVPETEKASRRDTYQPRTDISPSVPFLTDTFQHPIPTTPLPDPPHVTAPEPAEEVLRIPRSPFAIGHSTPRVLTPLWAEPEEESVPARPAFRPASSSLDALLFGQPSNSPVHRAPQFANTINNYIYYQQPTANSPTPTYTAPIPQRQAQPITSPYGVTVNGAPLDTAQYIQLVSAGVRVVPGNYWYDTRSGLYGTHGGPCIGQILPGMNLGGTLASNASGYSSTNVYINGREIHAADLSYLHKMGLFPLPGKRYWLDGNGTYGQEGIPFPPEGNMAMNGAAILSSYMVGSPMAAGCVIL